MSLEFSADPVRHRAHHALLMKDAQAEAGLKALAQLAYSDDKPEPPRQVRPDSADDEDFSQVDWLDG